MSDVRTLLERGYADATPAEDGFERMLRRRDRKRRNQRIAAGVVGMAVFVAAIWIVTSVGPLGRSETSVVSGGSETGPAETGPAQTGPAQTGPAETGPAETGPAVDPDTGWFDVGYPEHDLPPEGAVPSTPEEGTVVAEFHELFPTRFVLIYADGRVISWVWEPATKWPQHHRQIHERRLTPEGVELVRSGALQPEDLLYAEDALKGYLDWYPDEARDEVPTHVWEDPELKPFVPSRYSVCYYRGSDAVEAEPSAVVRFFPAPAQAILRGETTPSFGYWTRSAECSVVTTDEARALLEILGTMSPFDYPSPAVRIEDSQGVQIYWEIRMMLPHGGRYPCPSCG